MFEWNPASFDCYEAQLSRGYSPAGSRKYVFPPQRLFCYRKWEALNYSQFPPETESLWEAEEVPNRCQGNLGN